VAYRWPTDPPGKPPAHTISWQQHQANVAALNKPAVVPPKPASPDTVLAPLKGLGPQVPLGIGPPKGISATPQAPAAPQTGQAAPQPGQAAPQAGGAPAASNAAPITPDAQYLAEAAQAAFRRTQQLNSLTQEEQDDRTNTATAINRLLENAASDRVKIGEGANREGLFYSGQASKRLGDYEQQLNRARDDAQVLLAQRQAGRVAQRQGIEQGGPLDDAVAMSLAAQRQTARDTSAADVNALVPNIGADPVTASAAAPRAAAITSILNYKVKPGIVKGVKGAYHVYPDGRRVWVPRR
jgi:hypothetical protein